MIMSTPILETQKFIKEHFFKVILAMLFVLSLGYFMLYEFATYEAPFLGHTFHIVFGCLLMAIAIIITLVSIKVRFFQKKKRRSKRPVFLKNTLNT